MRGRSVAALLLLLAGASRLQAQITISGQVDVLAAHGYDTPLNQAFRGDDAFNEVRLRIFAQHWVNDRVGVLTELLLDLRAAARMNGAYVVIKEVAGRPWLDARVGLAPSPLGSFGMRSTYFNQNAVIGVPLVWQYRTAMDSGARANAQELAARRDANERGMPVMYDACWPIYAELSGVGGAFDFNVGVTSGAISNPMASLRVPEWQTLVHVGVEPSLGVRLGVSAAYGPYVGESRDPALVTTPPVAVPQDQDQLILGYDAEYARGRLQLFSEGYANRWDAPSIADAVQVLGGYVEARADVTPQVYAGGRLDRMDFSEIDVSGARESWDDDLWRWEMALGYRLARETLVRAGWQYWHYTTGSDPDQHVLALQLSTVF